MGPEELYAQAKEWANNRMKSQYFGSVIAIWIICNRKLFFGVFNFDESTTLVQKILWVHNELQSFSILGFHGFEASVISSMLLGFVIVFFWKWLSALSDFVSALAEKGTTILLQSVQPSKWVSRELYNESEKSLIGIEDEIKRKRSEVKSLESERETAYSLSGKVNEENFALKASLEKTKHDFDIEMSTRGELNRTFNKLSDDKNELERQLKSLNIGSIHQRTIDTSQLLAQIPKDNFASLADRQWIWEKTCLVHDYIINDFQISSDVYRNVYDWEIQLFARNPKSKAYLEDVIMKHSYFEDFLKESKWSGDRFIVKRFNPEESVVNVAGIIKDLLKRLEAFKAGTLATIKEI